jgi:hypothetical protein
MQLNSILRPSLLVTSQSNMKSQKKCLNTLGLILIQHNTQINKKLEMANQLEICTQWDWL